MGSDDWAILIEIVELLEPIRESTKRLEGRPDESSALGIAEVYPLMALILDNFEKLKIQYEKSDTPDGKALWAAIEQGWNKANEYYSKLDNSPVYTAAVFFGSAAQIRIPGKGVERGRSYASNTESSRDVGEGLP